MLRVALVGGAGDLLKLKLNEQISGSAKQDPADAATAWLKDKGLTN